MDVLSTMFSNFIDSTNAIKFIREDYWSISNQTWAFYEQAFCSWELVFDRLNKKSNLTYLATVYCSCYKQLPNHNRQRNQSNQSCWLRISAFNELEQRNPAKVKGKFILPQERVMLAWRCLV